MWPKVSIGIPTHGKRGALACRAVESVIRQTYEGDIEVVVVDDGSEDDTLTMLERFRSTPHRKLEVYKNDCNRGVAYSKNRCLIQGSGEYRGILDSDDFYAPTFVEKCVAALQANPELVAAYTDNVGSPADDWSLETLLRCRLRGDCWLAPWSVLERTQLHDEMLALEVDYDLFYQLAELGPLRRIPEPLHTVTEHAGRTTQDRTAAAYWHAAGLAKYGHDRHWAERRAEAHPEWQEAIEAGYRYGQSLAYRRKLVRLLRVDDNTVARWRRTWGERSRLDTVLLADVLQWVPERCDVADLGCGDGVLLRAVCAARPEIHALGMDFALPDGSEESGRPGFRRCDLRDDNHGLKHCFDVILCTEVIEHLQDPLRVFHVARQLLAPRGHMLLSTPLRDDIKDTYHLWGLRPADICELAGMTGGTVRYMQKTGEWGSRAVLYLVTWPDV